MTNFEKMDDKNKNFVELSDQELMEAEGGGLGTAALLLLGGIAWGIFF